MRPVREGQLELDPQTEAWIRRHSDKLGQSAPERILAEVQRLTHGPHADGVLPILLDLELLAPWSDPVDQCRAIPGSGEAAGLTAAERERALPLARLIHLMGDAGLERLRASRQQRQRCRRLRRWVRDLAIDPDTMAENDRYELHCDLDEDLPALILHLSSQHHPAWLQRWRDPDGPLFHPAAAVDGMTLQRELGLKPGPAIGLLLEHLKRERAFQRLGGRAAALQEAQRWCALHRDLL